MTFDHPMCFQILIASESNDGGGDAHANVATAKTPVSSVKTTVSP